MKSDGKFIIRFRFVILGILCVYVLEIVLVALRFSHVVVIAVIR